MSCVEAPESVTVMVSALPPVMFLATKTCAQRSVAFGATPHRVGPTTEVKALLPPAWLSVTLETELVVPPKRAKSTIVSPAALAALNVADTEVLPDLADPEVPRTSTGAPPTSATEAPLPLDAGLIVPEIE